MKIENWQLKIYFLPLAALSVGIFVSSLIAVRAQTSAEPTSASSTAEQGIAFPIPELGNCASKNECKAYCNSPEHMDACISFAKAHGLMNKDEAARAEKFRSSLEAGGGPGGCKSPQECEAYCTVTEHLEACVKFAKDQGFADAHVEQAEKILDYVKGGGKLPGGCNSKESCQQYCGDFSHAEECFAFAKNAGIRQMSGNGEGIESDIPPDKFQKFLELTKSGKTPGGCKSKDECEQYCKAPGNLDECLKFGEEVGFIKRGQAEKIRQLGGKGPGGCNSQESCSAYCNDSAHQQECFSFAKEHGLISPEELERTETGFVRMREGFSQAPPEVVACLKSELGQDALDDIQAGKLAPGPETAEELHNCFEKFGHRSNPQDAFTDAQPEVVLCLREKIGADFEKLRSGKMTPTPEMADAFRVCFQKSQLDHFVVPAPGSTCRGDECLEYCKAKNIPESECGKFITPGFRGGPGPAGNIQPDISQFLRSAPPETAVCLKEKLGESFEKLKSGEVQFRPEMKDTVRGCFEQFMPGMREGEFRQSEMRNNEGKFYSGERGEKHEEKQFSPQPPPPFMPMFPPDIAECLKGKMGADALDKISRGELSMSDIKDAGQACFEQLRITISTSSLEKSSSAPGEMSVPPSVPPSSYHYPENQYEGQYPRDGQQEPQYPQNVYEGQYQATSCPSGEYWNGTSCISAPSNTTNQACPSGQYWNGTLCMTSTADPATICAQSGGVWTGTTCKMP